MMTYLSKIATDAVFDSQSDLKAVRKFLAEHGNALANAAHTLGGQAASGRYFALAQAVRETLRLTRTHRRQLVGIHRLLTLKDVGDPERLETGFFCEIHPESPIVDEICLLSDKFENLLLTISADATGNQRNHVDDLFQVVA
jgi:hypothetical protein